MAEARDLLARVLGLPKPLSSAGLPLGGGHRLAAERWATAFGRLHFVTIGVTEGVTK
jgi:hypothetical protein